MNFALIMLMAATAAAPIADIPFDDDFGLVIFEVSIQGETLSFVLDTGFDVSILDAGVAKNLGLEILDTKTEAQPGGSVEISRLAPVDFAIGDLKIGDFSFRAIPIAAASAFIGRDFHGILGHDVLEKFVVDIDYPNQRLRFLASEGWKHSGPGQILPVTILKGEVFVNSGIVMPSGRTVFGPFKIDTGSIDVAGLNLNFVQDSALIDDETVELNMGGVAVGGETEGRLFRAEALVFGADRFEQPLIGYTVDSGGFENRNDAGTLGSAVLARYRLILDYSRNRIILEDAPAAGERAKEDLSGALIVSPPPAYDALVVAQVTTGSPSFEAGLAAGDVILSAGGGDDWTLKGLRRALQEPGLLGLTVLRDDEELEISLNRRRLLPLD